MNKTLTYFYLLGCIFVLGMLLRFFALSSYPVGFQIDEAILGYTGYSLLETGRDTNNYIFPLYTEVFGDYLPTGYHLLTIPGIKLFGLTEFSTRLPGALFGSISVLAMYFLALSFFRDKRIGLLSALFLAVTPWHIMLSRGSSEAVLSLFFIILGFAGLLLSIEKQNKKMLFLGALSLVVSYFIYHTPRLFVPLLVIAATMLLIPRLRKAGRQYMNLFFVASFVVIGVAFLLLVVFKGGTDRFNQVSIFSFPETRLVLEEQLREDGVNQSPILLTRFFHNKVINYSFTFLDQYFSHFTFNFLFLKGGLPIMFQIPNMGLLYIVTLPFLLYGMILAFVRKDHFGKIILIWLLLGPVVSALTTDDIPNIRRSVVMLPPITILSALGFLEVMKNITRYRKLFVGAIAVLFILNISYFLHQYFVHAKLHRPWYRNNGVKEMMQAVRSEYDNYDKIIMTKSTGGIYPLVLFYMQLDPRIYQDGGSTKDAEYTGFGKFFFVPQVCPYTDRDDRFPKNGRILYVESGVCDEGQSASDKKKIILKEDGTSAYQLIY